MKEHEPIFVYVTRYAMSHGIFKAKVRWVHVPVVNRSVVLDDLQAGAKLIVAAPACGFMVFGRDCFLDADLADRDARDRAQNRVAALEKQVEQARKRVTAPKWRVGDKP